MLLYSLYYPLQNQPEEHRWPTEYVQCGVKSGRDIGGKTPEMFRVEEPGL